MKHVGKVKEAHGLRGDLYVLVFSGDVSWSNKLETFQLIKSEQEQEQTVNLSVKKIKPYKKGLIVTTNEINNRTLAEDLVGAQFFVSEELFISKKGEAIYLSEILNFSLLDNDNKILGQISGFTTNGAQDILIIKNQKGDFLVPFVAPWVVNIDFESKVVKMNLPEGLFGE